MKRISGGAILCMTKGVFSFNFTQQSGYAWKEGEEVIVKIGHIEYPLSKWLDNSLISGVFTKDFEYTEADINLYTAMLKFIQKHF